MPWSRVFIFATCVCVGTVYAQTNDALLDSSTGYVPPGFEDLNNDYQGSVDVFNGNTEIGSAAIDFKDTADQISLSRKAQQLLLDDVKESLTPEGLKQVKRQLASALPAHSRLKNRFSAITEQSVSVFYAYKALELYVYIPNKYFKEQKASYAHEKYVKPIEALDLTPSLKQHVNINYDQYNFTPYQWQVDGAISSGPTNLIYDANSNLEGDFNDFHLEYFDQSYIYKLGYIASYHDNIIAPSGNIWGVAVNSSTRMMNPKFYNAYKTPFSIYLDKSYQVTIKQRGRILFQEVLPLGENVIDTSSFPPGTYQIDIEKRDLLTNTVTTQQETYFGSLGRYNDLYSGFLIEIGQESTYFNQSSSDQKPYIRISNGYNVFDGEVDLSYIYGQDINFIGAVYRGMQQEALTYTASVFLSQYADWYFAGNMYYRDGPQSMQLYLRNGYQDNEFKEGRQHEAGGSYQYNAEPWRLYANAAYRSEDDYQLSTIISHSSQWRDFPLTISLSNNYDGSELSTLLSLQLSYKKGRLSHGLSVSQDEKGKTVGTAFANFRDPDYYLNQRFTQSTQTDQPTTYYADGGYQNRYAALQGKSYFAKDNGRIHATSLGYQLDTNMVLTPSAWMISKDRLSTGVLVDLPYIAQSQDPKQDPPKPPTEFYVDNKQYASGQKVFVRKPDFSNGDVLLSLTTSDYALDYYKKMMFFYPNQIYAIKPNLLKSCLTSFTIDIPDNGFYTLEGRENDFFGIGGEKSSFQLNEGEVIRIKLLSNDQICDTGRTVKCSDQMITTLGKLTCKKTFSKEKNQ